MAVDITLIPSGHFSGGAHLALDTGDARDLRTVMNQLIATHNLTDAIATASNVVQRDANADVILPATPTDANAATPKAWVEAQVAATASGLRPKGLVKAASTGNLTLSGPQTIDGVVCIADDKVLAKNQTAPEENGLYVIAAGAWTRTTNLATGSDAAGAYLQVEGGTDNAEHFFVCTDASGSALVGTDALTFEEWGKIVSHENLDDLAGGAAGDHYHFTSAQHTVLIGTLGISHTVETTAGGVLTSAAKGTAYNKAFGATTGDVPQIAAAGLTASQNVQTDGSGDLVTAAITPYSFWTITVNPKDLAAAGTTTCEWQMPFAATLVEVSACAQTIVGAGDPVVDVQEGGVTVLSSTMDLGTAGAGVVVVDDTPADTDIADNANMTVLLTQTAGGASEECTVVLTFKVAHTTA